MVIAKPEWFKRRKYTGWGATPKDWRGWIYILLVVAVIFVIQSIPFLDSPIKLALLGLLAVFLIWDMANVMLKLKKDERETIHEAKAERNALWIMVAVLCAGLAYQVASSAVTKKVEVDWFVAAALIAGLIVKSVSNYYLDKRD